LQYAEEAVAAGVAAVGGKSQPALQENEGAVFDAFAGDMLEIEIAATRTMRVAFEDGSDALGVKPAIATVASPGAQAGAAEYKVQYSVAVGAKTIPTAAPGTNHHYSETVAENTEKAVPGQAGENM